MGGGGGAGEGGIVRGMEGEREGRDKRCKNDVKGLDREKRERGEDKIDGSRKTRRRLSVRTDLTDLIAQQTLVMDTFPSNDL